MKISCNILKKHIKNSEKIDFLKIWDTFTIRTAEVEEVTIKGNDIKDVVVGEVIECKQHPKKDKYHILKVDNGEEIVDILCGAPNVRKGLKTAIVKVGGMVLGFKIEPKEIAGVLSQGMLCSGRELGISDNHEGIIELPDDYVVGKNIKDYIPIDDIIVEIDNKSLTNRPDLWGHYGIAREIAAITGHELLELPLLEYCNKGEKLDIKINNPDLCLRYTGIKIQNIENNVSPLPLQTELYYTGYRSISLLVDLTNYVMIELGQPMHAFDATKVKSIEVGLAKAKDSFVTLDGISRKLTHEDLMIKKNSEYFGIAGIMGGLDSEIVSTTNSIVLESANFEPYTIRKTSIRLGLRTEASTRYEKSLDPNLTMTASQRYAYLLKELNPNMVLGQVTDIYPQPFKEITVDLYKITIFKNIGEIKDDQVISILTSLGFKVRTLKDKFTVTIPTYRATKDVTIEADLIEEIARMYGYENFQKTPLKLDMIFNSYVSSYDLYYKLKSFLAIKYNMHEVHSYLWYKTSFLNKLNIEKNNVKLLGKNEDNVLRDDLALSLIEIANENLKNYSNIRIFEIGTVIKNNLNQQILSFVISEDINNIEKSYLEVKNIIYQLVKSFKNKEVIFKKTKLDSYYEQNLSKDVIVDNTLIGYLKVLSTSICNKIAKKKNIIIGEIYLDSFMDINKDITYYKEVSKYPTVSLDYTIITDKKQKYIEINNILEEFKSPIIMDLQLIDHYVATDNNRWTIRYTIGSYDKTLEQQEIEDFKNKFIDYLEKHNLTIVK